MRPIWRAHYRRAFEQGPYTVEYLTAYGGATLQLNFNLVRRNKQVVGVAVFGEDSCERVRFLERDAVVIDRVRFLGAPAGRTSHRRETRGSPGPSPRNP